MITGRKPKPTQLKLVTSNPGKRQVNRKEAKAKAAIPAPPHHLTADAVEEWNRVAAELYNLGILSEIDRAALAAYAMAYGRWVQAERAIAKMAEKDQLTGGLMIKTSNGNAIQNPLVGTANKAAADSVPIAPELMTVRRLRDGSLEYEWSDNGIRSIAQQDNMLHIRGFGGNPLGGLSTLSFGRQTFGLAQAIERASGDTFRNGVRPSGLLKTADSLTLDQRKQAEELLQEKFAGAINAGRPMLLDRGMDWVQLSISPEDAQMLQSRAFSVEEVCRFFGVPPFMVGHTEKTTSWGTGLEQQTLGFQKFTLRRRLKRIEQALAKQLLSPADRQAGLVIEFNLEGLLRGDSAARASFYQSMLGSGVMTINEVRALENLPPVEGGDVPRMQMQNVPISQAGLLPPTGANAPSEPPK